jgi:hypothetical protein
METDDDSPDRETLPQSNSQSCEGDLSALVILPTPVAGQPTEQPLSQPLSGNTQESLRAEEHVSSGSEEELTKKIEEHVEDKKIEEHVEDKDDDFGDFGQFASTEPEMFPVADEGETRYSAFNSKVANKDVKNGINVIWPVLKELESKADHDGLFKDKTRIVPSITDRDWVNLYNILVNDTVFSENGGSRLAWRRSVIRQRFLESLNISEVSFMRLQKSKKNVNPPPLSAGLTSPAVLQEKASNMELAQKELPKVPVNQNTVLNDREKDLIEAKKLCDFAEGDSETYINR